MNAAVAPPADSNSPSPPPSVEASPFDITYFRVPNPTADGDVLLYSREAAVDALAGASRGAPLRRVAAGAGEPPGERDVRAAEVRLRRHLLATARRRWAHMILWLFAGPALVLLWVNLAPVVAALFFWLPPLALWIETLGQSSGGIMLATVVSLVPLIWAWRRAWRAASAAWRWRRLAQVIRSRRFRDAPLLTAAPPHVAAFQAESEAVVNRLRELMQSLPEQGAVATVEATGLARTLYVQAVRHGLGEAALPYHLLYQDLAGAGERLSLLERTDTSVLAERKVARLAERTRRQARALFGAFRPNARGASGIALPIGATVAGLLLLLLTVFLTGVYTVTEDRVVLIEPPGQRMIRVMQGLGAPAGVEAAGVEVVRDPGVHWALPYPLTGRHSVSLAPQRLQLRARLRQASPETVDMVVVELLFRITDLDRWSRLDADGNGTARLSVILSTEFEEWLQSRRQQARQAVVQQAPALANDPSQVIAVADQLVEERMDELIRLFISAVAGEGVPGEAGIQLGTDHRFQIVRQVPIEQASVLMGD